MARYLLVAVDKNDTAEKLRERLDAVVGLEVIGIFFKPTKFCEDADHLDENNRRSKRFGAYICGECGMPKVDAIQQPHNLLHEAIPARFRGLHLSVREPYKHPIERWGQPAIDALLTEMDITQAKIKRLRARRNRRGRNHATQG